MIEHVADQTKSYKVDASNWPITTTDTLHPDLAGHLLAGTRLAAELKSIL